MIFYGNIYFILLRKISFCLDIIGNKNKERSNNEYTFLNYLIYIFYPTNLYCSPYISFSNFKKCLFNDEKKIKIDYKRQFIEFGKILFWIIALEVDLHTHVLYAIINDVNLVNKFSLLTIIAALMFKILLFTAKYIVYYGLPNLINRQVGMHTGELPKCLALLHTSAEAWKYFDTGLYSFIKE